MAIQGVSASSTRSRARASTTYFSIVCTDSPAALAASVYERPSRLTRRSTSWCAGGSCLQRPVEPLAQLDLLGHALRRRLIRMIAEILGEVRIVQHPLMLLALAELAHHVGRDPEKVGERIAHEVGIAHAQAAARTLPARDRPHPARAPPGGRGNAADPRHGRGRPCRRASRPIRDVLRSSVFSSVVFAKNPVVKFHYRVSAPRITHMLQVRGVGVTGRSVGARGIEAECRAEKGDS